MATALLVLSPVVCADQGSTLKIGSKRFTESYLLGELLRATALPASAAIHKQGLGNTAIVFEALRAGEIDLYPDYTGTIEREILKHTSPVTADVVRDELARLGLGLGVRFGFNNGYALAIPERAASQAGIKTISDLARHPELRLGLTHEFLGRADGWSGLAQRYGLRNKPVGLDHGVAYQAMEQRKVDLIDIYATDARIAAMQLRVLEDDLHYFPRYDAVLLYRLDVPARFPQAWQRIQTLDGRISAQAMIRMNAAAEIEHENFTAIANRFLAQPGAAGAAEATGTIGTTQAAGSTDSSASRTTTFTQKLFGPDFWRLAGQHLFLVAVSVALATLIGVPLGVAAASSPVWGRAVIAGVGLLQTIPSLALLAMLIPLVGTIGTVPAIIALLLYALLPIVGNSATGLVQIPHGLHQAAQALGLSPRDRLFHIDLPLAAPLIISGIRTATVINIGTATIAAFIGAGGFGERIATGLALNDNQMLLAGAVPAAALALIAQLLFEVLERSSSRHTRARK